MSTDAHNSRAGGAGKKRDPAVCRRRYRPLPAMIVANGPQAVQAQPVSVHSMLQAKRRRVPRTLQAAKRAARWRSSRLQQRSG